MFIFIDRCLLLIGLGIWIGGTLLLRVGGQFLLRPGNGKGTLLLFAVSFPLIAWLVRRLCRRLPPEQWLRAALSLALPTLLLDPFSSAFFSVVFPNMDPPVAGVFGGWMLWCCAAGLVGAAVHPRRQP